MSKPFKTYKEQIEILKSRGLIIPNEQLAIRFLETENYYNVINGYKNEFLVEDTDFFVQGSSFEHIQALYSFDKAFRHGILSTLLDIENMLKSIISYEFAKKYGATAYLDVSSFNTYDNNTQQCAQDLIDDINAKIAYLQSNSDHSNDNIRHYLTVHGEIPIWVLFSHITLGDLSKFYRCLTPNLKKEICDHIVSIYGNRFTSKDLYAFFRILNNVRNLCAHNLRIYNYKTQYRISHKNEFVKNLTSQFGANLVYNNIISIVIIMYHLCTREKLKVFLNSFLTELSDLICTPNPVSNAISSNQNSTMRVLIKIMLDLTK